ncbi:MAG: acetyl-CoA hydrolase/transferase C-terminal domain-containing protein [Pseudorhodoferax sp.]
MTIVHDTAQELDLSRYIRPGDGIVCSQGTAEPLSLTEALVSQRAGFTGARVFCGPANFSRTFQPAHADHLRFSALGGIGTLRRLAASGALEILPCHSSAVEGLIDDGTIASDVVLVQVSLPNERGEHSFGLVNDCLRSAIRRARVVVAEINSSIPWTFCDAPLHAHEITVAVRADRAPLEVPAAGFGEVERRIAAHLADLIPDRATLQVGIGAIPEAVASMLADRRDLGVHSGVITDVVADLIEAGVVTNAYKGMDEGVAVAGALYGTRRLYNFAHRNAAVRLCPLRHTHGAAALARLRRLVSINSALEVDLSGQVNAEAVGADHMGAVGGQVDYVRAAAQAEDGLSIIAMSSVDKQGRSKIVPSLSGPVTTARSDVEIVATEHGIARLRGMSLDERARALVGIAAPEHRDALRRKMTGH